MFDYIFGKIKSTIFSKITPFQLLLTSVLAFVFGFIPGIAYSPLLFIGVLALVIILRINIGVFVFIFALADGLSFLLESVSFSIGRLLLDGPTQPLFKVLVNTPVVAYAGFDYYLVTGAFVLSIVLGFIFGLIIAKVYKKTVYKMSMIQTGTELYNKITKNFFVKILSWFFLGKNVAKVDWVEMKNRKMKQPFRMFGVLLVGLAVTAVAMSPKLLETAMVSNIIKQQMSKANGATVDYDKLDLNISKGELSIQGLGAADPMNLNKDRFYASNVSASLDLSAILTKQLVLDNVVMDGVSLEKNRDSKGELYGAKTDIAPVKVKESTTQNITDISKQAKSIDKLNIQQYEQHVDTAKKVANGAKKVVKTLSDFSSSNTEAKSESLSDAAIENAIKVYGYANIRAEGLEIEKPMFTVSNLLVRDYKDGSDVYNLVAKNISTNPALLGLATTIDVKSANNNNIDLEVVMANKEGAKNSIDANLQNLGKNLANNLNIGGIILNATNANVKAKGDWNFVGSDNAQFNIPVEIVLENVSANYNGFNQKLSTMTLNGVLKGDLRNPDLDIDMTSLDKMFDINEVAGNIVQQAGLDKHATKLVNNTKINGKNLGDMNADDVKNLASSFGVKF